MNRTAIVGLCAAIVVVAARPVTTAPRAAQSLVQTPATAQPNTFGAPVEVSTPRSPTQIHPDRTVTFRLRAPDANTVEVSIDRGKRHPLSRNPDGVWTATLGPFEPDVYGYQLWVDGVPMPDPLNPVVATSRFGHVSVLDIPGSPARFDEWRPAVPHGSLHVHEYFSTVLNVRRRLLVYVPPQYDSEPTRRFPVLYLRHGNGQLEGFWAKFGHAGVILENLIAEQKATPMLIVMPNGYPGDQGEGSTPEGLESTSRELISDIVPFIEKHYRVIADADHRAIAGLSMGAGQSFTTGLQHLDTFRWIGVFSSGLIADATFDLDRTLPTLKKNPVLVRRELRLLFLSCGTEDPRYPGYLNVMASLKNRGIPYVWFSTPGAHEFKVWRHSLAAMLPMLFANPRR